MTSNGSDLLKRTKALIESLADSLKKGHTEGFMAYLNTMAKFHSYSVYNQLLIAHQYPKASLVAGMKKWNQLGRFVVKGNRAIKILAPIIVKQTHEDGKEVQELMGFREVNVFDVSQTQGQELPEPPKATGNFTDLQLNEWIKKCPVPVSFRNDLGLARGATNGHEIWLAYHRIPNYNSIAKTLLHEISHIFLGHFSDKRPSKEVAEAEAECVAYVVASLAGIQAEEVSRDYILNWGGNAKTLEDSLNRISGAVKKIVKMLGI